MTDNRDDLKSLEYELTGWFDKSLADIPEEPRRIIEDDPILFVLWDGIDPLARRKTIRQLDCQHGLGPKRVTPRQVLRHYVEDHEPTPPVIGVFRRISRYVSRGLARLIMAGLKYAE